MTKTQYLSLISGADSALELAGIRQSVDHDPNLLALERSEVERALDLRGQRIAAER